MKIKLNKNKKLMLILKMKNQKIKYSLHKTFKTTKN